jgi:hypothetical protein
VNRHWLTALVGTVVLTACSTPADRVDDFARSHGLQREVVRGDRFDHVIFRRGELSPGQVLRVYLEGDGQPYLDRWTVARDPTPLRPLMLDLLLLDAGPAIYVGRPCYFGLATTPPCTPSDWTLGRFSLAVVDSLAAVIGREAQAAGAIELFGHSGGGTLVVLLARRLEHVTRIVTLAGNLDPTAWVALHRYSPLQGSLDPLAGGPLPPTIAQLHFAAQHDRTVPAKLVVEAAGRLGSGSVVVLPAADHTCCWHDSWPAVLSGQLSASRQRNW